VTTSMVRLREETRRLLQEMATQDQVSMQEVAARAMEAYRRQRLLDQINADFAALRADPEAWQAYRSDLAAWDSTLLDGLD
jgi:very-short-patch-repair endonuclease